jgi:signal transduction histidine kinase
LPRAASRDWARIVLLAAAYYVAGKLGLRLADPSHPSETPVWPPTGIALTALLLGGMRLWPGVFVGAFLVNLTTAGTVATSLGIATGNTLEVVAGAWFAARFAGGARAFETSHDTLRFAVLTGVVATTIAPTIGVSALVAGRVAPAAEFATSWTTWWLGDMGGALIVAPLLLLWWRDGVPRLTVAQTAEALLLLLLVVASTAMVFGGLGPFPDRNCPVMFLCTPFLVWAAIRFRPADAMAVTVVLCGVAIAGTRAGYGPFGLGVTVHTLVESQLLLQSFLNVCTVTTLVLSTTVRERRAPAPRLVDTAAELGRSNSDLERFAHAASHDLKEPLRTMASFAQLLQSRYAGRVDADADQFVRYVVDGATRMQRLVDDLLAYSRVGSEGVRTAPVAAEEALAEALAGLKVALESAGALVSHDALPVVKADGRLLTQLFQNLVDNAVKFRRSDPARVHVSAQFDGRAWVFSVRDNGIGIDPRYADRIFTMFRRLHGRDHEGSGIGLALCKRIVERHGGRIWLASEPGKGSTFYFSLPG